MIPENRPYRPASPYFSNAPEGDEDGAEKALAAIVPSTTASTSAPEGITRTESGSMKCSRRALLYVPRIGGRPIRHVTVWDDTVSLGFELWLLRDLETTAGLLVPFRPRAWVPVVLNGMFEDANSIAVRPLFPSRAAIDFLPCSIRLTQSEHFPGPPHSDLLLR
jgi:hypothetical protein